MTGGRAPHLGEDTGQCEGEGGDTVVACTSLTTAQVGLASIQPYAGTAMADAGDTTKATRMGKEDHDAQRHQGILSSSKTMARTVMKKK